MLCPNNQIYDHKATGDDTKIDFNKDSKSWKEGEERRKIESWTRKLTIM